MKKSVVRKDETLMIFSRHPTHSILRKRIIVPVSASIRFGSKTMSVNGKKYKVQLNLPEAVEISSDKLKMKTAFRNLDVKTAPWVANIEGYQTRTQDGVEYIFWKDENVVSTELKFPIVTKHRFGSRGTGNQIHKTIAEFETWFKGKPENRLSNYIAEQYVNYSLEYRIHVSKLGAFYSCRKAMKEDTPEDKRWFRNDSNSVWFMEENEQFMKPSNWEEIVAEAQKAAAAVGLDVAAIDVRVQSDTTPKGKKRETQEFFILETNSAPSFGDVTAQKYEEHLPLLIAQALNQ